MTDDNIETAPKSPIAFDEVLHKDEHPAREQEHVAEKPIDPHAQEIMPTADPVTARQKLRAFEDEHFGKDAVRVNGEIERGHGSPFADMDQHEHRQYAALELLIAAEQRLADSTTALAVAEAEHEAALARLEACETNASG